MSLARLKEFLDSHNIKYVTISHSVAYTSQGIAALTHIPGKELAKTVIVKIDGALAAVLTASSQVDLSRLSAAAGGNHAVLASEQEFKDRFPDCETGAMPPFGNLYDLRVFADESLRHDKEIAFNAGSHRELVRMVWEDFEKLRVCGQYWKCLRSRPASVGHRRSRNENRHHRVRSHVLRRQRPEPE